MSGIRSRAQVVMTKRIKSLRNRRYYLYALVFPSGKRYIGITHSPDARMRGHKYAAKRAAKFAVHHAMVKHGPVNVVMQILVMGQRRYIENLEVAAIEKFKTTERRYGYNTALGGDYNPAMLPEVRARIGALTKARLADPAEREKIRASKLGKPRSAATRLKISLANKGRHHTPEAKALISAAGTGRKHSAGRRAKISATLMGHGVTDEARTKMRAAQRARFAKPEERRKLALKKIGRKFSAAIRAKMVIAQRARRVAEQASM